MGMTDFISSHEEIAYTEKDYEVTHCLSTTEERFPWQ